MAKDLAKYKVVLCKLLECFLHAPVTACMQRAVEEQVDKGHRSFFVAQVGEWEKQRYAASFQCLYYRDRDFYLIEKYQLAIKSKEGLTRGHCFARDTYRGICSLPTALSLLQGNQVRLTGYKSAQQAEWHQLVFHQKDYKGNYIVRTIPEEKNFLLQFFQQYAVAGTRLQHQEQFHQLAKGKETQALVLTKSGEYESVVLQAKPLHNTIQVTGAKGIIAEHEQRQRWQLGVDGSYDMFRLPRVSTLYDNALPDVAARIKELSKRIAEQNQREWDERQRNCRMKSSKKGLIQ